MKTQRILLALTFSESGDSVLSLAHETRPAFIGGESDPTYVQLLAEGWQSTMKLINKGGQERVIKP